MSLVSGCTSVATLQGARPLEPGQRSFQAGVSLQYGSSAVSGALGLPVPQLDVRWRRGLAPDLDWGLGAYLFGVRADLRYRFAQAGRWHFAAQPGLALAGLPVPTYLVMNTDLDLPVLAEVTFGQGSSLTLSGRVLARESVAWVSSTGLGAGVSGRYEFLAGGGMRYGLSFRRVGLGVFGDGLANTTRGGPAWITGGVDVTIGPRTGRPRDPDEGS
ncbi:MAG: hypothetical protein JXB39_04305 [Deltaproteobacteria bacterium]|nr:hypothetical protein [Deltaproteobacteria bacterium]